MKYIFLFNKNTLLIYMIIIKKNNDNYCLKITNKKIE